MEEHDNCPPDLNPIALMQGTVRANPPADNNSSTEIFEGERAHTSFVGVGTAAVSSGSARIPPNVQVHRTTKRRRESMASPVPPLPELSLVDKWVSDRQRRPAVVYDFHRSVVEELSFAKEIDLAMSKPDDLSVEADIDLAFIGDPEPSAHEMPSVPDLADFCKSAQTKLSRVDFAEVNTFFATLSLSDESLEFSFSMVSFLYRLYNLRNLTDLFFAGLDFLKATLGVRRLIGAAREMHALLTEAFTKCLSRLFVATGLRTESRLLETLQTMRSSLSAVLDSEFVTAIRDFVLALVSFRFFEKDRARDIQRVMGPAKPCTAGGLAEVCLGAAVNMLRFAEQLFSGEPLLDILTDTNPVQKFIDEAHQMTLLEDMTYTGLPVAGKVDRVEYTARVQELVNVGYKFEKELPRSSPMFRNFGPTFSRLQLLHSRLLSRVKAEERPTPMAIVLHGDPGIGKGLLLDYLCMVWSDVKGRQFDARQIYSRLACQDYWEGYESLSMPFIHYSEPGALHAKIAASRGDPTMVELLSVCDNKPFQANMAELKNKGNVYVNPEMVVIDTNTPDMNIHLVVNNPAAVRRRFLYIKPKVMPEFKMQGSTRLDQLKSLNSQKPTMDRWLFDVYTIEPAGTIESHPPTYHLQDANIYRLTEWLKNHFEDFIVKQDGRVDLPKGINVKDYLPEEPSFIGAESVDEDTLRDVPLSGAVCSEEDKLLGQDGPAEEVESRVISPPLQLDPLAWALALWLRFGEWCVSWCVFGEVVLPFALRWLFSVCMLLCAMCMFFGAFACPNNIFLKVWSLQSLSQKWVWRQEIVDYHWQRLRAVLGFSSTFQCQPPPTQWKYVYAIAGLTAVLSLLKFGRITSTLAEGHVLSVSKERTEEQVDTDIFFFSEQAGAERGSPRSKRGNAKTWEWSDAPRPVPITEKVQKETPEHIEQAVRRNVRYCLVSGQRRVNTHVTGVCADLAIINKHCLGSPNSEGLWNIRSWCRGDQMNARVCNISRDDIVEIDGDLWLVRLRGNLFRDIRPYFAADFITPPVYGLRGSFCGVSLIVRAGSPVRLKDKLNGSWILMDNLTYDYDGHGVGLCGTPLIVEYADGRGVCGIHSAGATDKDDPHCRAHKIRRPDLEKAVGYLEAESPFTPIMSEGALRLPPGAHISDVSQRSPLRYEECVSLDVYGRISTVPLEKPGRSKLQSTEFIHHAEELTGVSPFDGDGRPLFAAPVFSSRIVDGEYMAPYNHFIKKAGAVKRSLDPRLLSEVVDVVVDHLVTDLRSRGVEKLSPITLELAQNGDPEDFYLRAMKPSTSGGFAFRGPKKKFATQVSLPFKEDAYMPNIEVREQVLEQLEAYRRQENSMPLLGAQLKDEPRSYEKVRTAKTRVFCMSSYDATLLNRMYLSPFYTLMVEHDDVFGSSIGINMHSTDVDDFVTGLQNFSHLWMEGDYGGFDTSMPYDIGLAANTVVYRVLESFGYAPAALEVVRGILSDNLHPVVVMNGDLFSAPSFQPSGKYATAEDNSLRGLLMLVYAWGYLAKGKYKTADFYKFVKPKVYGDDMLAAVKPEASAIFNNLTYQSVCKVVYGLDFTNAGKTLDMEPFLRRETASFLKRSFVWRDDLGHWVAPLARESVMKTICYTLPSREVPREVQLTDACISAARELFFHESEEEYATTRSRFIQRIAEIFERQVEDLNKVFPTFTEIRTSCYGDEL